MEWDRCIGTCGIPLSIIRGCLAVLTAEWIFFRWFRKPCKEAKAKRIGITLPLSLSVKRWRKVLDIEKINRGCSRYNIPHAWWNYICGNLHSRCCLVGRQVEGPFKNGFRSWRDSWPAKSTLWVLVFACNLFPLEPSSHTENRKQHMFVEFYPLAEANTFQVFVNDIAAATLPTHNFPGPVEMNELLACSNQNSCDTFH